MSHIKKQSSSSSSLLLPSSFLPLHLLPSLKTTPRPRNPHIHRRNPNHHLRVRIHIRALRIQQRHDRARARVAQSEDLLLRRGRLRHHHQRCCWWWWCCYRCCCWRRGLRREVVELSGWRDFFDDDGGVNDAHLGVSGGWEMGRDGGGEAAL